MTSYNTILVTKENRVTVIELNRPESRNAINGQMAKELEQAFLDFNKDDGALAAVITGRGSSFCGGADLKVMGDKDLRTIVTSDGSGNGPIGPSRMFINKPVIAAVNGFAVAGGLELSLIADIRIADEDAVFGVFCRRWGVPLIDGGTIRLPRLVGMGFAMDMILSGRGVPADEALAMGLVNRVVAQGKSLDKALEYAETLTQFPQECMLADRRSAYLHWGLPLDSALRQEGALGAPIVEREGVFGAARFADGEGRHGRSVEDE